MGLDMYLHRLPQGDRDQEQRVMYWRKASAIHRYFTKDAKEDNCIDFPKTIEDIQALRLLCINSIEEKEPLLETGSGFFWGSTEYDSYYWEDLQDTADAMEAIISEHQEGDTYEYSAWY